MENYTRSQVKNDSLNLLLFCDVLAPTNTAGLDGRKLIKKISVERKEEG
jgi:hypothetical protein